MIRALVRRLVLWAVPELRRRKRVLTFTVNAEPDPSLVDPWTFYGPDNKRAQS